jgi:hypothetical protein
MPPTISYHEIRYISSSSQSAHSLVSTPLPVKRHSHHSMSFRHISLAHKRRFRHRRYPENSSPVLTTSEVTNPPLLSKATTDLPSMFLSTERLATSTMASGPTHSESALLQLQAARNRATTTTAALIAVCVVVGLTACTVMVRLVYHGRFSLSRCLRRHRRTEDDLGFVFIQYDDSTWGTPAKELPREMPSFENGTRETGGGLAQAKLVTSGPWMEVNPIPVIRPLVVETINHSQSALHPKKTKSGLCRELTPIIKTDGQCTSDAISTEDVDSCSKHLYRSSHEKQEVPNALGLAIECNGKSEYDMLASPQLAAAFARRASEDDDTIEETEFTITDSPASNSAACGLSMKSSGSEEDYELQTEGIHSVDFKRGIVVSLGTLPNADCDEDKKTPLDLYSLPRVVISASSSVASEVASESPNRASGMSEMTVDLGDFPRPPFISDTVTSTSTSFIAEIEVSLGPVIGGSLGMAGRRASSAPQLRLTG